MLAKLKKWVSGEITWKEEKALRQQALKDDFLADAMEGYEQFPATNHLQKIHQLNQKVRQRSNTKSTVFPARAIAATLVVLISAGTFWYVNTHFMASESTDMVYSQSTKSAKKMPSQAREAPLSSSSTEKIVAVPKNAIQTPISKIESSQPAASTQTPSPVLSENPSPAPIPEKLVDMPLQKVEFQKEQEMVVLKEEPTNEAEIRPQQSIDKTTIPAATTLADALPPSEEQSPSTSNQESTNDTYAEKVFEAPRIVSARKTMPAVRETISKSRALDAVATKYDHFQKFALANLQYPKAAKQNRIKGVVRLSYQVTSDGQVENIEVLDSLGYGCEEEAIRLLRLFPFPSARPLVDTCAISFE